MDISTGSPRWTAEDITDQSGRTFVVTGANSGLGLVTAEKLARRNADVIMAVRDEAKGRRAVESIRAGRPDARLEVRRLDLADLDSVTAFARRLAGSTIDGLVNNGGIMMPPRRLSPQGFESQFATNHLGHFALTGLLLGSLGGPSPVVVTVSSSLHRGGRIRFDDLTGERSYSPTGFYRQSKFANVLFALELDRRLRAAGSPVRSVLAHPGYSATNLQITGPSGLMSFGMRISNLLFAQSATMGALNQLYAATDPDARGGQFIGPRRLGESRGHPALVQPDPAATDPELAARLWEVSEELTGVHYDLPAPV